MKFVKLTIRKIINIIATGCYILRLKCTKFDPGVCPFVRPSLRWSLTLTPLNVGDREHWANWRPQLVLAACGKWWNVL